MGQHNYNIADFCKPNVFLGTRYDQEVGEQSINDVVSYLNKFYQHEDYYDYFIGNGMYEQEPDESTLQIQYLYVYTIEKSQYFMNKFIYGNDVILK
jgi:hypothetical protein